MRLWAPYAEEVEIEWVVQARQKLEHEDDYFIGHFPDQKPGAFYWFHLNGKRIPDPASRYQPQDTIGPSCLIDEHFEWTNRNWQSIPYEQWVIYEIHVGTFSESNDFTGIIADLPRLQALGITTIELMPLAQFSGRRNWGYDGVFPHAVQHRYGGPNGLKQLVDACHAHGMAIILDVVFNHLGPDANILPEYGPYLSEVYGGNWGKSVNFDEDYSDEVDRYFLQAAWQWLVDYHFDGLRLDAVHSIFDISTIPFVHQLYNLRNEAAQKTGRPIVLIGESDRNDPRTLMPPEQNGLCMDAQWADDLHNVLHVVLTGEQSGYYRDYGGLHQLARTYQRGMAFEGEYSTFRHRSHGKSFEGVDKKRLIVASQNHDQIGNRPKGERLISLVGIDKAKLAAAAILLSPFTPHLCMGEEFASDLPFNYFASHHDVELMQKLKTGRQEECSALAYAEQMPDPAADETFQQSVLRSRDALEVQNYYKDLISLSKQIRRWIFISANADEKLKRITLNYEYDRSKWQVLLSFNTQTTPWPSNTQSIHFPAHTGNTMMPFSAALIQLKE